MALPLLALIAVAATALTTWLSPGPILFRQERVGYRGEKFKLYKFRTMHVRAETASHQAHFAELVRSNTPMQKLDAHGDSRLVPGGWLLRTSGLDELPQIINVLRGEMSIVGPRPSIPYEYEQYSPPQRERFACVPGLTGLWQVSGKNRLTFEQMVHLDIEYTRRKSPWQDLKIIALTVPALCAQIADSRRAKAAARPAAAARIPRTMDTAHAVRE
jgi:lipopolysaccharide/colanic/teichoic acid biosynthesis glycosyltransferase